jgi:drug/metabolite transporter (DMT)-like permease
MDARTLTVMCFTVFSWASAFPAIRLALAAYGPAQLAFLRFVAAGVVLLGIGAAARLKPPTLRDGLRIGLLGVIGIALYAVALGYGQKQVPAGSASLLIASAPAWMVLIAAALGQERPTLGALAGITLSFAGVALIASTRGLGLSFGPHALSVLGAALAGATYTVLQRPLVARYGALRFTLVAVWGGALALTPAAPGAFEALRAAPLPATLAIAYLAVVPGALGYASWAYISGRLSTAAAGSTLYLVPAVSMVLSHLVLGEVPSAVALAGGALVLLGGAAVHRRKVARPSRAPERPWSSHVAQADLEHARIDLARPPHLGEHRVEPADGDPAARAGGGRAAEPGDQAAA